MSGSPRPPMDIPLFDRLRYFAAELLSDRQGLLDFLEELANCAEEVRIEVRVLGDELHCLVRLLKSWASGEYEELPRHTLLALVVVALYLALTLSSGPSGWLTKAATLAVELVVLKAIFRNVKRELDAFRAWERKARSPRFAAPRLSLVWSVQDDE